MAGCFTGLWDLHQIKPLQRSELLLRLWPTKQHHAAFKAENWDTLNGKPQWERGTAGVCFVLLQGSGSMIIRILLDTELNCTKLRWPKATWSHASRTGYNIYWAIRHSVPFNDLMPSSPFFSSELIQRMSPDSFLLCHQNSKQRKEFQSNHMSLFYCENETLVYILKAQPWITCQTVWNWSLDRRRSTPDYI